MKHPVFFGNQMNQIICWRELDLFFNQKNLSAHKYSTKNLQRKEHFSKNNWMSFGDDFVDPFFEFLCLKKHHQRTHFQFGGKFFCCVSFFESQRAWIKDSNSSTNFSQGFFFLENVRVF